METIVFNVLSDHLSINNLFLILQLLIIIYIVHIIVELFLKNYVQRWLAFRMFKNNMMLGVGTKITLNMPYQTFTGHIKKASKDKVVVSNEKDVVVMGIQQFMNSSIIIHNTT